MRSRAFAVLLVLAAVVGVLVSLAAWSFLEAVHWTQQWVLTDIPRDIGYDNGTPLWWYLPVLTLAGVLSALAIVRLPGRGGHVPAHGLKVAPTQPVELPGVLLAALAALGLGVVLGPEAPLIALGGGLATFVVRQVRSDAPAQVVTVMASAGAFAALSFIFDSPLIAAVILIEASGIGGPMMPLILLPGMLAAGIGSLISIGLGSWTGLSTGDYALGSLSLPQFARPDIADFLWSVLLAVVVAVVAFGIIRLGRVVFRVVESRELVLLPVAGLAIAGLAIAFAETTDKGADQVLFSGQTALPGLVSGAGTWSLGALALLVLFKGLAWAISLGGFRGGPVFPTIFLGAAAGLMASHLAGFAATPAVAVGMGAAVVSVLGLPLSAVVLAVLLTSTSGAGATPLIIVAVVVAHMTTLALKGREETRGAAVRGTGIDAPGEAPAEGALSPTPNRTQ
jgi:H+/Cl- antiporter ClcA